MTRRITRTMAALGTGLATLLGAVLATASPASADDGAAPSCVSYYQSYYYLQAENTCDYDVHVYARYVNGAQTTPSYLKAHTSPTTIGSGYGYSTVQSMLLAAKVTVWVHYNVGYGNNLAIRGDAAPLSWSTGEACVNRASDLWECTVTGIPGGTTFQYKVLINDTTWSTGSNYTGVSGHGQDITPAF
ncbi:UNVERIFIED_ORG: hypothetical protein FHR35_004028 [Microbispora rosea subsp. rosea]